MTTQYIRYPANSNYSIYDTFASFPAIAINGALASATDTDTLYIFDAPGTIWKPIGSASTVFSIGTIDSVAATANGAAISGNALIMQSASATVPGLINNTTQSLSGNKTFTGTIAASNLSGTNTGDVTLAAIGSTANANAASLSGQQLTLQPASASFGGILTAGTQSIAGNKTFTGTVTASNISGSNTGDVTLAAIGAVPNANAASLSGQQLTLQPASGSFGGVVTSGAQIFGGNKIFNGLISAANLVGTNTGDVTLTDVDIFSPNAQGAILFGQTLTLCVADGNNPGLISELPQVIGGTKTFLDTLYAPNGSASVPSYSFLNFSGVGLSCGSSTTLNISASEKLAMTVFATVDAVNYISIQAFGTGLPARVAASGTDTNVGLYIQSKGTSSISFYTDSGSDLQFQVVNTNNPVNYVYAKGGATGSPAEIGSLGSDLSIDFLIRPSSGGYVVNYGYGATFGREADNYLDFTGALSGSSPQIISRGTDSNIGLNYSTKGTGGYAFYTDNLSRIALGVIAVASSVNYVQFNPNITTASPALRVVGSDANIGMTYNTKGIGAHAFYTGTGANLQLVIPDVASSVNYINLSGGITGAPVAIFSAGANTNVGIDYISKGTGVHSFYTGATPARQMMIRDQASAVNYVNLMGGATGQPVNIFSEGANINVGINYITKGIEVHAFYTGGGANRQVVIHDQVNAVNYINFIGSATGSPVAIFSAGSDTNVGINYVVKGTSSHVFYTNNSTTQFLVSHAGSAVNFFEVYGGVAGDIPTLRTVGSNTDIGMYINAKGLGSIRLLSNNADTLRLNPVASAINYWNFYSGNASTANVYVGADGSGTDINMDFASKGVASLRFFTNSGSQQQMIIAHTVSAVNYLMATGAATSGIPEFAVLGSDANISMALRPKGTGGIYGYGSFIVAGNSLANQIQLNGSTTTNPVTLAAVGSDTNIAFGLAGKGTKGVYVSNGGFQCAISALATNATTGHFLITSCAGTPSGVPVLNTGSGVNAMVYDTSANKIWVYNGSWRGIVVI